MKKILFSSYVWHGLGLVIIWSYLQLISPLQAQTVSNSIYISLLSYLTCSLTLAKLTKHLLVDRIYYLLPVFITIICIVFASILMLRLDYSRSMLIQGYSAAFIWLALGSLLRKTSEKLSLTAINNFDLNDFNLHKHVDIKALTPPYKLEEINKGLVVNLHHNLNAEQEKFIADCSLNNIPVFHSETIRERLEGKVRTTHLSENAVGTLLPNQMYGHFKRTWESLFILFTLPLTLPLMLSVAVLIRLESKGRAIFIQERIGQRGKAFRIYKFRSMTQTTDESTSKFATEEQRRLTRLGKFIRKTRIDELPQFFNVLKGDMALIGPRPEQANFVKQFETEIPFYGYRHMVKPGITGWAQTVQGYTDNTDSTREKLAYDLYYIKHFSFWLDINIVFKTLKTMLTGFGAK